MLADRLSLTVYRLDVVQASQLPLLQQLDVKGKLAVLSKMQ